MTNPIPQPSESQPEQKEWEKEFDDQFTYLDEDGDMYLLGNYDFVNKRNTDNIPQIKSFISTQRQQAAEDATKRERERCLRCVYEYEVMDEISFQIEKVDEIRDKIQKGGEV